MPGWWYVASAESFLDRMISMPAILDLAPSITCPVLFVRGNQESPESYPAEEFQARAGGPCDVERVPDCDHFYVGGENRVTDIMVSWLAKECGLAVLPDTGAMLDLARGDERSVR
jgi:pimeloyl-ACP methyl ester carboxylesterase